MPKEKIPKLIMNSIPRERRKRGCPRKMWMEVVQPTMKTINLDKWKNRDDWRLVSGTRRHLFKNQIDR